MILDNFSLKNSNYELQEYTLDFDNHQIHFKGNVVSFNTDLKNSPKKISILIEGYGPIWEKKVVKSHNWCGPKV